MHQPDTAVNVSQLQFTAIRLSREVLRMTTEAGSGHPSSSLSMIDLLTALYFGGGLRHDPTNPEWSERDRFILSKGHGAPGLYAALAMAGYFQMSWLDSLRQTGSPLEGHPNMRRLPGVEASTGSLGQGLSIGLGHALAARLDGRQSRVYVMLGDGEVDEGQVWEATMAAAQHRVDNLTAVLDANQFQQTGPVAEIMMVLKPLADKWRTFGWRVFEIDGHNMVEILETLNTVRKIENTPQMIIARTQKGRGLSPFVKDETSRKHGKPLDEDELAIALAELDAQSDALRQAEQGAETQQAAVQEEQS